MNATLKTYVHGLCIAALTVAAPVAARAETTATVTGTDIGFSSPGNLYGPWSIADLRTSNQTPGQAVDFDLAVRSDKDQQFPSQGVYGSVEYIKDLGPRFYMATAAGYGSSGVSPLPHYNVYQQFAYKLLGERQLVMTASEDNSGYTQGITSNQISVGPMYYGHGFDVQALYTESANTGALARPVGYVALDIGTTPNMESKVTATVQFGPQSYESAIPGMPVALGDLTGFNLTLGTTQWVAPRLGFTVTGLYGRVQNVNLGRLEYIERGIQFGIDSR